MHSHGFTQGSIEFRDKVWELAKVGHGNIYALAKNTSGQTTPLYHLLRTKNIFDLIDFAALAEATARPVYMEDFAQALVSASVNGDELTVEIFTD
ncbi:hypothetical protein [Staphylococcus pasteuri]|uniref:hypothetical protein n=1 Tax=Staphylococcus pasteuri TaxID=45972 RepID=UPI0036F6B0AD